ncbi:MAG: response regulator [Ignavibacteria bacterium]|nr:response regulator [Ignavibacteria bacterium]
MKTLIVDDEYSIRQVLKYMLSKTGKTDQAVNGEEAIRLFLQAWIEKEPYDLICMDIMMPLMDGKESVKAIREQEKLMGLKSSEEVKIMMITALGDPKNVVESYYKSGADAYVVKPFDKQKFWETIEKLGLKLPNNEI